MTPSTVGIVASGKFNPSQGALWGWGRNNSYSVGDGTNTERTSPVQVGSATDWEMVSRGIRGGGSFASATGAIKNGRLYTWGADTNGILGNGAGTSTVTSPTQIGSDTDWTAIAVGDQFMLAIKDGKLYSWGNNGSGRTGLNTDTGITDSPTQVGSDSDWTAISAGEGLAFGIRDGKLYAWGANTNYQTGLNTNSGNTLVPTQVGSASNWASVSAGQLMGMALRADGTLWGWGDRNSGRNGLGSASGQQTTPAQVGSATDWAKLELGLIHGLAIRTNGDLYSWGRNLEGQLGDGTTTQRNSPVRIGTSSSWTQVTTTQISSGGINDGKLFTWGSASRGQLGNGTTTPNITSPTQIGSDSNWKLLGVNGNRAEGMFGIRG